MLACARGCTGQISGSRAATSRRMASASRSAAESSTLDGRCKRDDAVAADAASETAAHCPAAVSVSVGAIARALVAQQRIDHHVADEAHALATMPSRARLSAAPRSVV